MGSASRARGFTLLEVLVVIAIVAIIAGTLAVGVARNSPDRMVGRAMEEITTELSVARVEAMQRGRVEVVDVGPEEGGVRLVRGERVRGWKTPKVQLQSQRGVTTRFGNPDESEEAHRGVIRAEFDTMGRTRARRWEVWIDGAPGRIWAIEFDPVSGAPRLRKPGVTTGPGQ